MKSLNPNGSESINGTRRFPTRAGRHDLWMSHGVFMIPVSMVPLASGLWILVNEAELLDGDYFYYQLTGPFAYPPENPLQVQFENFVTPGRAGWWEGEAYNFVVRPAASTKWTIVELRYFQSHN